MKYVLPFNLIDREDVRLVGGKAANLGEMTRSGFPVPRGVVLTSEAYFHFLESAGLKDRIDLALEKIDFDKNESLTEGSALIRRAFLSAQIPSEIELEIKEAYQKLSGQKIYVAVRSSSTGEDLLDATGAGARITILNAFGEDEVLRAVREVWASLFTPRSIFYIREKNKNFSRIGVAVVIQEMVESKVSGVSFSIEPVTNNKNIVVVEAVYGLGELVAQGQVTPDHFELDKKTLEVIYKEVGLQDKQLIRSGRVNKLAHVSPAYGASQKISDDAAREVGRLTKSLEQHYMKPQDVEWAHDGKKLYVVQTRPVTTSTRAVDKPRRPNLPIVLTGAPGSPGIVSGKVVVIGSPKELDQVRSGDILVSEVISPDYIPAMKRAAAIVTDKGGRTAHAAIISRELGVPAVVGTGSATKTLTPGKLYTVNGTAGHIYSGGLTKGLSYLPFEPKLPTSALSTPLKTATKIVLTLTDPTAAGEFAKLNPDGAIIAPENLIRKIEVHPKRIVQEGLGRAVVQKLAEGILSICQAFQEKPVFYRLSNFTSTDLEKLKGGAEHEPHELNPKLGLRGAQRHLLHQEELGLELEAVKRTRNVHGVKNLHLIIPFVRTPDELAEVKKMISSHGLHRGNNFKIFISADLPINILTLERFSEVGIDGVIGGEHLIELLLGIDLAQGDGSKALAQDEVVAVALEKLGREGRKMGLTAGFNFEGLTPNEELVAALVASGYSFISVTPDAFSQTRQAVASAETEISKKKA
jgi:pyruvate,water dikinase